MALGTLRVRESNMTTNHHSPNLPISTRLRRKSTRRGTAVVEFAICLPILSIVVFGVIEASNAIYVQQAITSAAYEAANVASATGGTAASAQTRANAVLTSLGITSATVTISPAVTASTALGTKIVVTCTAPLAANMLSFGYMGGPTLKAVVTIAKL